MALSLTHLIPSVAIATGISIASAGATVVTFNFDGNFATSHWNADSSNQNRTPAGSISGYFSVDTDSLTVIELSVATTFLSIYNNQQVMGGAYHFGVPGETDDWLGTSPAVNRQISGVPSLPTSIPLLTDLTGGTDPDGGGLLGNGSIVQIMDPIPAGTFGQRAYRPRLSLFLEGVDFRNYTPAAQNISVAEEVWNVNIGNGIAGYSGSQSFTSLPATIPEPYAISILSLSLVGWATRRTRAVR